MVLLPGCPCCGKECCTIPCGCTLTVTVTRYGGSSTVYRLRNTTGTPQWDTTPPGTFAVGQCSTVLGQIAAACPSAMPADPSVYEGKCCISLTVTDSQGCKSVGLVAFNCEQCCGEGCVLENQHFAQYKPTSCGPCATFDFFSGAGITNIAFAYECDGFQCCEYPPNDWWASKCLSLTYTINGVCNGTVSSAMFTRSVDAGGRFTALAYVVCGQRTLTVFVRCNPAACGLLEIYGTTDAFAGGGGCPTFYEGRKRICGKSPDYSQAVASHAVSVRGVGACANLEVASFTLAISEPPC